MFVIELGTPAHPNIDVANMLLYESGDNATYSSTLFFLFNNPVQINRQEAAKTPMAIEIIIPTKVTLYCMNFSAATLTPLLITSEANVEAWTAKTTKMNIEIYLNF
ncbi:hypothetical protein UC34_03600 [Pandoraea vervacti]|uniref:Uncharacterized protein n=2 Tax=Pandoraea vervacti TaxID=656178 RepID=A0ABM5SV86_9BURK|nr:hypothetical protein UC34_03600 [Pandoraea vervacti]